MTFKTRLHKALGYADFVMIDGIDMETLHLDGQITLEDDSEMVAPNQDIEVDETGFAWFLDANGVRHEATLRMYRPFAEADLGD